MLLRDDISLAAANLTLQVGMTVVATGQAYFLEGRIQG